MIEVQGDGNCFPRAIAVARGMSESDYWDVKKDMVQELQEHKLYYLKVYGEEDYNSILRGSRTDGEWTMDAAIHVIANAYFCSKSTY